MSEPVVQGGPTALRVQLGAQLRKLREKAGVSRADAAYEIRSSESKISRMELGRVGFKLRDVNDLLILYGVNDDNERAKLVQIAREANQPGWWNPYSDLLPSWFASYLGLEESATMIRTFEPLLVPGLLQTENYARAVVQLGRGIVPPDEIDRRVQLRAKRQEVLKRKPPRELKYWAVIDEAALRRPIGGNDVMREQIESLIESTRQTNITIQIIPFDAGGYPGTAAPFTILRFAEGDMSDLVYLEHLTNAYYVDKPDEFEQFSLTMDMLAAFALPPSKTEEFLGGVLKDYA